MSGNAATRFPWADGKTYRFALPIAQLEELQDATGAGPEELLARLSILPGDQGGIVESVRLGLLRPRAKDLIEVHRLGLIGGGEVKAADAAALADRYVARRPRAESYVSAHAILLAAVMGVPEDAVGKSVAEEVEAPASQMAE